MTTATPTIDRTGATPDRTNPFPGLRPFREDEESLFFGRESQVDAMVDKLAATRFLSVVGTSGSGKSSLVNCGLRPALHRGLMAKVGTTWRMAQFRSGADPVRALAGALAQDGVLFRNYEATGLTLAEIVETTLRMSKVGLIDIVEQARLGDDVNLLVVVDQFEELFRYRQLQDGGQDDAYGISEDAASFVNLLLEATEEAAHSIYVVLTMRSDFLGECARFPGLAEAVNDGQYLVPRLTRDERRAAIDGPIGVGGAEIEPVLLTRLLNDVGDNPDQLSILQHALNRTWAAWEAGGAQGPVRLQHYEAVGTMTHALDRHAERAFGELRTDRERKLCERTFKALTDKATDPRGVRRPATFRTLCELTAASEAELAAVLDVFRKPSRSFVMPPAGEGLAAATVIDISHESLMRIWQRLNGWADEEAQSARVYRRLAEAAAEHEAGEASLLRDPELQFALNWRDRNQPNESWASRYHKGFAPAMRFLAESGRARDKARRASLLRVLFVIALVVLAALGFVAFLQRRTALAQRRDAENASKAATLLALTATANDSSVTPLSSALLLSLAAYGTRPSFESRRSVVLSLAAAAEQPLRLILRTHAPASALALSPDGHTVATADRAGHVRRWDLRSQRRVGPTLSVVDAGSHTTTIHPSVAFGPDSNTIAEGTDARLTLWDSEGRAVSLRDRVKHVRGEVRTVAFSPAGKILASSGFDGLVRLWDVKSHRLLARFAKGIRLPVNSLAFTPDGRKIASAGDDGVIRLWDVRTHRAAVQFSSGSVNSVAFSPDGQVIAAAGDHGAIRAWLVRARSPARPFVTGSRPVVDLAVSRDGNRVAGASHDGTVRVWDTGTGKLLFTATSPGSDPSRTVNYQRDGRLVSVSADGTISVWGERSSSFGATLAGRVSVPAAVAGVPQTLPVLAASPDARILVAGGSNGLRFWDATTRKPLLAASPTADARANAVAFGPAGTLLAEAVGGDIQLWRARDLPRLVPAGRAHVGGAAVDALAFSRDGLLAIGKTDGRVYLWDSRTPGAKPRFVGIGSDVRNFPAERFVFDVTFSPDGRTLASGGWDGTLRLWRVRDRSHTTPLGGPRDMVAPGSIRGLAFSPDSRLIAVGSADGTISLWDSANRKELRETTPGSDSVESVAFTGDGRILVTAGDDGAVRIWDVGTLRPLGQLVKSHVGKIRRLALTPDDSVLATAENNGDVRLWPGIVWPNTAALTARICHLVAGGIADAEWKAIIPAGVKQPRPHLCGT